jgi:hypothetical protein
MPTSRTSQAHARRVNQIAEEAAAKTAEDSPLAEDVIVTIEEVPPSRTASVPQPAFLLDSQFGLPFATTPYTGTLAAIAEANVACVQAMFRAQVRFAGRLAAAISPRA